MYKLITKLSVGVSGSWVEREQNLVGSTVVGDGALLALNNE